MGARRAHPSAARRLFRLAALACALAPGAAVAAEPDYAAMSLEELGRLKVPTVYGASKREQKATEAPASVTVVTQDDIRKFGYRTLGDILRGVRGFYVTSDRVYGYVGVRGFNRPGDYGGRILVLIDGHRINDPIYDSVPSEIGFPLDVDLIDRVEIIRGPGQVLYGNNAFLAVLNVVSRRGRDFRGSEVSGSAGSLDSNRGRFTWGGVLENGLDAVVSAMRYRSAGDSRVYFRDFDDPATNDGIAEKTDRERALDVFGSLKYRDFSFESAYSERTKQVPSGLYGTVFNDPRHEYKDTHGFAELQYRHAFPGAVDALARVFYHRYAFEGDYPFAAEPPDPPGVIMNRDEQVAQSFGGELQVQRAFPEKHALTGGIEYRSDYDIRLRNYDANPVTVYQDTTSSGSSVSIYAQDEYRVSRRLILNLGLRLDRFRAFGSTVNPRIAVIYTPMADAALKFVYGTGFRGPNAWERSYASTYHVANEDLEPETVASYELIWEQGVGERLRMSVSGFRHDTEDLIGLTKDSLGNDIFDNFDSAQTLGGELEVEGRFGSDLRARASYTFARTVDGLTGRRLDNSPRHLAQLRVDAPVYRDKLHAGVEVQCMSSRNTVNGDRTPGFAVANITLYSRSFWKGMEISASLYNFFDENYSDPGDGVPDTVPQAGRSFWAKLTYRF